MLNTSGLRPLGQAVLVKPYEPEVKKGLIELPAEVKERYATIEQRAIVLAIGPEAWVKEKNPRAAIGDHVFISKHAGYSFTGLRDGDTYRMVNCNDVFAEIEEDCRG